MKKLILNKITAWQEICYENRDYLIFYKEHDIFRLRDNLIVIRSSYNNKLGTTPYDSV